MLGIFEFRCVMVPGAATTAPGPVTLIRLNTTEPRGIVMVSKALFNSIVPFVAPNGLPEIQSDPRSSHCWTATDEPSSNSGGIHAVKGIRNRFQLFRRFAWFGPRQNGS